MTSTTLATLIHGVGGIVIVVAATVLLALNKLDSTTAMALYSAGIGLITGSAAVSLALKVPTSSSSSQSQSGPTVG